MGATWRIRLNRLAMWLSVPLLYQLVLTSSDQLPSLMPPLHCHHCYQCHWNGRQKVRGSVGDKNLNKGLWCGKGWSFSWWGRVYRGGDALPPKIFYEYYPWKWCILVHFSTNLDFRVEGLNPEVGEGVNNWVWWVQPLVPPIHCILLLCVADVLWWDMISIVIGKSHRRGHIPRCTPPRISWWRWTPTRCVKSSMYP